MKASINQGRAGPHLRTALFISKLVRRPVEFLLQGREVAYPARPITWRASVRIRPLPMILAVHKHEVLYEGLVMSDTEDQLATNSQKPKRVVVDGNVVEQHSLKEQMDFADRQAAIAAAAKGNRLGIRREHLSSPGASE